MSAKNYLSNYLVFGCLLPAATLALYFFLCLFLLLFLFIFIIFVIIILLFLIIFVYFKLLLFRNEFFLALSRFLWFSVIFDLLHACDFSARAVFFLCSVGTNQIACVRYTNRKPRKNIETESGQQISYTLNLITKNKQK